MEYYPNVLSSLNLGYITNNNSNISVDGRTFKGLIKLEDKVILIVNQENNKEKNMNFNDIISIVKKHNMSYDINIDNNVNIYKDNFKKTK